MTGETIFKAYARSRMLGSMEAWDFQNNTGFKKITVFECFSADNLAANLFISNFFKE